LGKSLGPIANKLKTHAAIRKPITRAITLPTVNIPLAAFCDADLVSDSLKN